MRTLALSFALCLAACGGPMSEAELEDSADALVTPVTSLSGLAGTYARFSYPIPAGEMSTMSLSALQNGDGRYSRSLSPGRFESGTYHAIPENPAVGFAAITFIPPTGASTNYIIDGIRRDVWGRITTIQLRRVSDVVGTPFLMMRTF
jgi:hypothetical protein